MSGLRRLIGASVSLGLPRRCHDYSQTSPASAPGVRSVWGGHGGEEGEEVGEVPGSLPAGGRGGGDGHQRVGRPNSRP